MSHHDPTCVNIYLSFINLFEVHVGKFIWLTIVLKLNNPFLTLPLIRFPFPLRLSFSPFSLYLHVPLLFLICPPLSSISTHISPSLATPLTLHPFLELSYLPNFFSSYFFVLPSNSLPPLSLSLPYLPLPPALSLYNAGSFHVRSTSVLR